MTKKITAQEAAEFMGYKKVGRYYFDYLYLIALDYNDDCRLGAPCYDSEGDWHNNKRYKGKEVIQQYTDYMKSVGEEEL